MRSSFDTIVSLRTAPGRKHAKTLVVSPYLASGCTVNVFTLITFPIFPKVFSHGAFPNNSQVERKKENMHFSFKIFKINLY